MKLRVWAPTLAALALVFLTVSLGNWQLRRADEKRALQAQREAAERAEPIDLAAAGSAADSAAGSVASDGATALAGRRVRVHGRFVPEFQVFVDNRTHRGVAGFHVLAPLRIAGSDRHVLVLRGWIAGDPRARARLPAVRTPDEPVALEGIALRELPRALELAKAPLPGPQDRLWQNADLPGFEKWSGLPMRPLIVRETRAPEIGAEVFEDGLVRDWPQPGAGVDTHLAYAFQWYALAALVAGLWIRFVLFGSRKTGKPQAVQPDTVKCEGKDDS